MKTQIDDGYTKTADFGDTAMLVGDSFFWSTASVTLTGSLNKIFSFVTPATEATRIYLLSLDIFAPSNEALITISEGQISSSIIGQTPITRSYSSGTTITKKYNTDQLKDASVVTFAVDSTFAAAGLVFGDLGYTSSYTTLWSGKNRSGSYLVKPPTIALKTGTAYEIKATNTGLSSNEFVGDFRWIEKQ